jgi:hypothetical protein
MIKKVPELVSILHTLFNRQFQKPKRKVEEADDTL